MFFAQNITRTVAGLGYGYLYNWYAVSHVNFAPSGWHVPTWSEIETLLTYLGGWSVAGGKMKETGTSYWNSPNTGADNSSGFTSFGAGLRAGQTGYFSFLKEMAVYCTSTHGGTTPISYKLDYNDDDVDITGWGIGNRQGYSIRLLKDDSTDPGTMTDYDGNTYDTIKIGDQVWTVQNWKCTKLNDGTALTKVTSDATWVAAVAGDYYYCAYDNDESNV